jgi:prophage antirepressor-like protein
MQLIRHDRFGSTRGVLLPGAVPSFAGKDFALGYGCPRNAVARHVKEKQKRTYKALQDILQGGTETVPPSEVHLEGGTETVPPSEVQPETVFVSEAGMFSLVLASKLPAAEAFKDWVCEDVLPALRRHGRYSCLPEVHNERELHAELVKHIRAHHPEVRVSPGLGEMQDTSNKRIECWSKGYQKGQPDLIVHRRSGQFSGFALELKTPKGCGILSAEQRDWLEGLGRAGYKTLVTESLQEAIQALDSFLRDARVCCKHCGSSFISEANLRRHVRRFHPAQ